MAELRGAPSVTFGPPVGFTRSHRDPWHVKGPNGTIARLPNQAAKILLLLERGGFATIDQICAELWPNPDREPSSAKDTITTYVSQVRRAIKGTGWKVKNVWSRGYFLTSETPGAWEDEFVKMHKLLGKMQKALRALHERLIEKNSPIDPS